MNKVIEINELKKIQMDILDVVHSYCLQNEIHYALAGGSMIGAVRHGGFIPWDDDIDILIPRIDYDKFCKSFNDKEKKYKLHCLDNDSKYSYPFAKIEDTRTVLEESVESSNMGITIDVFPVDNCFDSMDESIALVKKISKIKFLYKVKLIKPTSNNSFVKKIGLFVMKLFLFPFSLRTLALKYDEQCKTGKANAKFVANLSWGYGINEIIPREVIEDYILISFEDRKYNAFKNYDLYLTSVYGDYMQLPPKNKRHSPHTFTKVYWK